MGRTFNFVSFDHLIIAAFNQDAAALDNASGARYWWQGGPSAYVTEIANVIDVDLRPQR